MGGIQKKLMPVTLVVKVVVRELHKDKVPTSKPLSNPLVQPKHVIPASATATAQAHISNPFGFSNIASRTKGNLLSYKSNKYKVELI